MTERWKPVIGWEGLYEVSDQGRVKSFPRRRHKNSAIILAPTSRNGYAKVNLCGNGQSLHRSVHRLMLEAFIGPCPEGMVALHRNGNASDCRLENLHWGTQQENMQDRLRHGTHHNASKTRCAYDHPLDEANTIWRTDRRTGSRTRECHTCRIERVRRKSTAAVHTAPAQIVRPGEVYGRFYNGHMTYLLIANALYELPDAVMTHRCDEDGNQLDNKIRWTSKDTLRKFWRKTGYQAAMKEQVR